MFKFILIILTVLPFIGNTQELTSDMAKKISNKAFQYASKKGWKISISLVNSEGNLVYFERGDGAYVGSIGSSMEKAESANSFQRPTSAFVEAIKSGKAGLTTGKKIVAIEGGVPIIVKGKHVGAIGISGAKAIED